MPQAIRQVELSAVLGEWTLWTAAPRHELVPFVRELWEVRGDIAAFRESVLPNGQVEVMFNLGPPHRVLDGPGAGEWTHSWLSGLHERAIRIESLNGTHLLAARLHPLGAVALFGDIVPRTVNDIIPLDRVIGADAERVRRSAMSIASVEQHFAELEALLLERSRQLAPVPQYVAAAARAIEESHGRTKVARLHEDLAVSRKHLAVSFRRFIGMSAKRYALTQRFVWTLAHLQSGNPIEWSTLAGEAGYADQSHLVRDFRRVGAASPLEYVRRVLPGATALLDDRGTGTKR